MGVAHRVIHPSIAWTTAVALAALAAAIVACVETMRPYAVASVEITAADLTLTTGARHMLAATVKDANGRILPDATVTWQSLDPSRASISEAGEVTAVAIGTTLIVASSGEKADSARVTVTSVPVASVSVGPPSTTVTVGATTQLTATVRDAAGNVLSGRAVSWASSNTSAATVSGSGLVTGVAAGSATVTATSEGKSGSSAVTVTVAPPPPVASVTVTPSSVTATVGATTQLTATLRDAAGTILTGRSVSWSSADLAIATVSTSGLVTGAGDGQTTVAATSEGKTGASTVVVTAPPPPPGDFAVLLAAGDIANCGRDGDERTAALLDTLPGIVATLGDNAYQDGTLAEYENCYGPNWGRHKARTRPSPGNHEYQTPNATGYFAYFGAAAGEPGKGYYSYEAGPWHVIALNDNIDYQAGSPQETWLRADLAAHPNQCTLAYFHRPRFTSGVRGGQGRTALWQALYDGGADVILVSHDHLYERFAPQRPDGTADPQRGIRQFTVGTGGSGLYEFGTPVANSEVRNNTTYGLLKLTLRAGGYDWKFIPVSGQTFTDAGSGTCH